MAKHKVIILGPQCSGKTTLVRYLRKYDASLPITEEDEAFARINGGTYPADISRKENVLRPRLEQEIRNAENIIFVTSYCNPVLLGELKSKGYKIVQLTLDKVKLLERNKDRMKKDGYDDARQWLDENLIFHQEVLSRGLVDKVIDVDRPVEIIAKRLLPFLKG